MYEILKIIAKKLANKELTEDEILHLLQKYLSPYEQGPSDTFKF